MGGCRKTASFIFFWWEHEKYNELFWKQFVSFYKLVRYACTLWSRYSNPRYLLKRKANNPYKNGYINVYSLFIFNSPKLETF